MHHVTNMLTSGHRNFVVYTNSCCYFIFIEVKFIEVTFLLQPDTISRAVSIIE